MTWNQSDLGDAWGMHEDRAWFSVSGKMKVTTKYITMTGRASERVSYDGILGR